jgi:predicted nucleic acid-binding Zn ribbon protein
MAKYEYKCTNIECNKRNEIIEITKPMSEATKTEYCEECKQELQKVFSSPGVKTGDGYKS